VNEDLTLISYSVCYIVNLVAREVHADLLVSAFLFRTIANLSQASHFRSVTQSQNSRYGHGETSLAQDNALIMWPPSKLTTSNLFKTSNPSHTFTTDTACSLRHPHTPFILFDSLLVLLPHGIWQDVPRRTLVLLLKLSYLKGRFRYIYSGGIRASTSDASTALTAKDLNVGLDG
jgi:hypothetical protein